MICGKPCGRKKTCSGLHRKQLQRMREKQGIKVGAKSRGFTGKTWAEVRASDTKAVKLKKTR